MPYCTNCGNFLREGDKFCSACGKPVSSYINQSNINQSNINQSSSIEQSSIEQSSIEQSNSNINQSSSIEQSSIKPTSEPTVENSQILAPTLSAHTHQEPQPTEQKPITEQLNSQTHEPAPASEVICPCCGRKSKTLKSYTMFKECLFLGCYIKWQMVTHTCCPDCMRKKMLDEGIFTSKIITANVFWLFIILPLAIIQLFLCSREE